MSVLQYVRYLLLHNTAGRDHVDAEAIKAIGMHDKQHEVIRSKFDEQRNVQSLEIVYTEIKLLRRRGNAVTDYYMTNEYVITITHIHTHTNLIPSS